MDEFTTMTQETTEQVNGEPVVETMGTDLVEDSFNEIEPWHSQAELPVIEDTESDSSGLRNGLIAAGVGIGGVVGGILYLKHQVKKYCDSNYEPKSPLMAGLVAFEKKKRLNKKVKAAAKEMEQEKKKNESSEPKKSEGEPTDK